MLEHTGRLGPPLTLISSTPSDAHTWNLIYLQLLLEEEGHRVINLGACVPHSLLVDQCLHHCPDLVVVSSVNGHGFNDAFGIAAGLRARAELRDTPLVLGGKLSVHGVPDVGSTRRLLEAGFDAVYAEDQIAEFRAFLRHRTERAAS